MIAPIGYTQLVKGRTWLVVLGNANYRCQCTGECGQTHPGTTRGPAGRCVQEAPGRQLVAAPADPAATTVTACRAHIEQLHAWCPSCLDGAVRKARRDAASTEIQGQLSLVDLADTVGVA